MKIITILAMPFVLFSSSVTTLSSYQPQWGCSRYFRKFASKSRYIYHFLLYIV